MKTLSIILSLSIVLTTSVKAQTDEAAQLLLNWEKLQQLEKDEGFKSGLGKTTQHIQDDLFASLPGHPALDILEQTDPDQLTPRQAQELLYRLKELHKKG